MSGERHTYNMGLVGNCAFMGYIDTKADIKWMCWPRFDSSFIFGGLIDEEKGGNFSIIPNSDYYQTDQKYIENTNVLETTFTSEFAAFKVIDFAPRFEQNSRVYKPLMLVRRIVPIKGTPRIKVSCNPVGDYGKVKPEVYQGSSHIRYEGLGKQVRLSTNIPLNYVMNEDVFVLNEPKDLILTYGVPLEGPLEETAEDFQRKTVAYWRNWAKSTSIGNYYQKEIIRSGLLLKIKQYEDTGAIIAAGTTSLPEHPGSGRNWDYRFCWMRDTYYTLQAFNSIGHFEELERYFHYIENTMVSEEGRFQPLYAIDGKKKLTEVEMDLAGYKIGDNQPVRVGNDAYTHIQNDVYGQVIVSLLPLYVDQRFIASERIKSDRLIMHALKMIEKTMNEKDAGLWEFRNLAQEHCYTFLFHWAGAKAGIRIAEAQKNEEMYKLSVRLQKEAAAKIEQCRIMMKNDPGYYSQAVGTDRFDASCLQLISMNYIDPKSELAKSHLAHMEKALKAEGGLFYRYIHADDFGEVKSTFLICAFWYVEALAQVGRVDEAVTYFEDLNRYANHVGLLSEDVDASSGSQWGNFPQAYSHVGQINAAYSINKKLGRPNFF